MNELALAGQQLVGAVPRFFAGRSRWDDRVLHQVPAGRVVDLVESCALGKRSGDLRQRMPARERVVPTSPVVDNEFDTDS